MSYILSSSRLAENLAVNKNIGNMSSPRLAEFSAVKIYCELLSSPRLAENLAVNKNIGTMTSPRLAGFSAVKEGGVLFKPAHQNICRGEGLSLQCLIQYKRWLVY